MLTSLHVELLEQLRDPMAEDVNHDNQAGLCLLNDWVISFQARLTRQMVLAKRSTAVRAATEFGLGTQCTRALQVRLEQAKLACEEVQVFCGFA
jgi:hypothetical protein